MEPKVLLVASQSQYILAQSNQIPVVPMGAGRQAKFNAVDAHMTTIMVVAMTN